MADGTDEGYVLEGSALGAPAEKAGGGSVGEVVFNTGMTGYQEILSDPSYAGQLVLLTYPLIGNYGVNDDDFESSRLQASGLIVREACTEPSNWRSKKNVHELLEERGLMGIEGIDTRKLAKKIRSGGASMGVLCDDLAVGRDLLAKATGYTEIDFVSVVSTREPYKWGRAGIESMSEPDPADRMKLAVLDCGLKYNILRRFWRAGCRPIVFPHSASAEAIMAWKPDGILLSPGPGDPQLLESVVSTVRSLLGRLPMFGICLGNQILCQAVGGKTFKLKFGHHGSNHPVKDLRTGKVTITSQNHGFAVDPASLEGTGARVTQINLNDDTVEGIEVAGMQASSIQYHPEAAPGPWDSRPYFAEFVEQMRAARR